MNNYNCLDLNVVKEKISEFAFIEEAKYEILNEVVDFNPLIIKKKAIETNEALNLIRKDFNLSFDGIENINSILDKADKGICLNGQDLIKVLILHNNCSRIKKQFNSIDAELNIKDYIDTLKLDYETFNEIEKCLDLNGDVKDDASDKLRSINSELLKIDKDLYNRAHQFIDKHTDSLQENTVYERNNRVCFLIKNSDKNKYNGFNYGTSASNLASYVEPEIFIELNNTRLNLIQDKEDEIIRILTNLSYKVSNCSNYYRYNFDSIKKLCIVFSKAYYGFKNNGIIPSFSNDNYFEFKDLCHPLIDVNKVVSNSYRLFNPYKGIVISGSNTGGKTVSLKAIGLSILMSYLGIPILCSEANVPIYNQIYVDIDDNQSIEDSLSTFSAHITNINSILNNANEKSLILIDELISGTDPKQAQAISLAILDKIKDIKSQFIITTHFDDIKNYAYKDQNILLSSVGFDMENLKPTYKYIENTIGSSNALEIASRYFSDKSIIENAAKYLKDNQTKEDELLDTLSKQIAENELIKNQIEDLKVESIRIKDEYENKLIEFENNKKELKKKYELELQEYIDDIKQKANIKLENIKTKEDKKIIEEIEELDIINEEQETEVIFNVDDNVRINDNEQIGTIIEIKGDNVVVDLKGIKVKTKKSDLTLMPKVVKKEKYIEKQRYERVPSEINLVGQRVEEGLILFEEYIDKANAANMSSVKIIHGIGTGALRSAIRDKLKKMKFVSKFSDGDFYDGGSAVTIVEFKK